MKSLPQNFYMKQNVEKWFAVRIEFFIDFPFDCVDCFKILYNINFDYFKYYCTFSTQNLENQISSLMILCLFAFKEMDYYKDKQNDIQIKQLNSTGSKAKYMLM